MMDVAPRQYLRAELRGAPQSALPQPATARMLPLQRAEDFAALRALPKAFPRQVFITMRQMQDMMAHLVETAFALLDPLDICLLTVKMPAGSRVPARLLRPDVFMINALEPERAQLEALGNTVLAIDNGLVRTPFDAGDNSVTLSWNAQPKAGEWEALADELRSMGFHVRTGVTE